MIKVKSSWQGIYRPQLPEVSGFKEHKLWTSLSLGWEAELLIKKKGSLNLKGQELSHDPVS